MDNGDWNWIWLAGIAASQKNAEKNKENADLEDLRHKADEYKILAENAQTENEKSKLGALARYYQDEYEKKSADIEIKREQEKKVGRISLAVGVICIVAVIITTIVIFAVLC